MSNKGLLPFRFGRVQTHSRSARFAANPVIQVGLLARNIACPEKAGCCILGFVSVSYRGCGESYEEIVKERSYLIQINQKQISSILLWIAAALLFWDLVILLALRFGRMSSQASSESPDTRLP
jgi:hypothetical protein